MNSPLFVFLKISFANFLNGISRKSLLLLFILVMIFGSSSLHAQVATYYNFSQSNGTYIPATSGFIDTTGLATTTPAKIFITGWDDRTAIFRMPFNFTYNGVLYPAGTGRIGLDADAWFTFSNGNPVMTGTLGGGSWVSTSDHSGVYLFGNANNNGFAGFNCDLNDQSFATFTGTRTSGLATITGVSSTANLQVGTRLSGAGIPDGTIITGIAGTTVTMSANATSNSSNAITPRASIIAFVNGVAPNRQFVIQWTQAKRYSGGTTDNINFQMLINEAGGIPNLQTLQVIYGTSTTTDVSNLDTQVGLRGADSLDFNARKSTTGWAATTAATVNTDKVRFSNTIAPASGLTFTWSPCTVAPGAAGVISGSNPACAASTATYTLAAVAGATTYTWTYSGTGATFSATTSAPSNAITFAAGATGGTLMVTPSNLCGSGAASSIVLTISPAPVASISYPLPSYCNNVAGTIAVTQTGTGGGTYSAAPAGLTINGAGGITPSTSTPGVYTVTYSFTNGTCSNTTTASITIASIPVVTATATPSLVCNNGNSQLQASVAGAGTSYSVTSIPYVSTAPSGSPTVLWNSYTDEILSGAIALPFTLNYFGQAVNQIFVSSNGYIQLQTSTANTSLQQTLPDATNPNNIIALAWDDLEIDPSIYPGANVRYFVNGISPNRIMVVEFNKLDFYFPTDGEVTGQIKLYENDSHIEVAASTIDDAGYLSAKTMGIENNTGTIGLTPAGRNNVVFNFTTPEAWSFTPVTNSYSYLWTPATFLSNTAISNPVATAVSATTAYNVLVTNTGTGCSSNTAVTVTVSAPLNGTYTVGAGGNFTTLTAAVNAYNTLCIGGPVVFSLIDNAYPLETFPIVINSNAYASAVNTLTIKPAATRNPVISGNSDIAIIKLNGADYITIDGSNTAGGTTRNLSLINTSTDDFTSTIVWLASNGASNGATNNTVKNCIVTGNAPTTTFTALISSGADVGEIAESANSSNTYQNNLITKCQTAIAIVGPTGNETGNVITGNTIGSTNAGEKLSWSGIELYQQANAQVTGNVVFGITSANITTASGISVFGTASGITISGNKISDVKNTSFSAWGCNGIYLGSSSTAANVNVFNNFIFDVASYGYNGGRDENDNGYGIIIDYGGGYNIYYNTVHLNTSQTANGFPACINITSYVTTAASVNIKNNIFSNVQTNGGQRYAIESEAANNVFGTINYNAYYTLGNNLGYIGSNRAALANIQAGFGQNLNSINYLPVYTSATDYHINAADAGNITNLENRGNPVTGISDDYDVQTRNGLTPDMGADEWVKPNYGSWVGKVSIDWLVPANWEANYVPDLSTDVFITGGYTFMPTVVTTQAIRALALSAPGTPPLLTINGGTLQVYGNITRTGGTINGSNGTMEMKGSAAQSIPAGLFQNNNLKNLIISNTDAAVNGGVTLGGKLDIYRSLTFGAGGRRFATGGFLTLKSTASETAWLGQMTGTNIISGDATIERYIPIHSKAWQFLSTPITALSTQTVKQAWQDSATVANQNRYPGFGTQLTSNRAGATTQPTPGFDVFTAAGPSVKVYNRATGGYTGLNRTDTAISNPKGYMVFVRGDRGATTLASPVTATVMRTKGTLHTPANPPAMINIPTPGFESVGNPYASAINFRQLNLTGGVQTDFFYVWDPKLTTGPTSAWGLGGFQTFSWNGSTFNVVPGGGSYTGANRNIESGQAFFVNAPFSAGTLSFTESSKVSGSYDVNRSLSQPGKQLRTNLYVITESDRILLDGNLVQFNRNWSNAVDIRDGIKLNNSAENFGLTRNGKTLSVESHALLTRRDTIFYNTGSLKIQQYEMEFIAENIYDANLEGFLEDKFLHTSTPVSLTGSTLHRFTIVNDAGSYAPDRFYLVFRKVRAGKEILPGTKGILSKKGDAQEIETTLTMKPGISVFPNPVSGSLINIRFIKQKPGIYQVQLNNELGQQVYTGKVNLDKENKQVPVQIDGDISKGVYYLTIVDAAGRSTSEKVIIN